MRRSGRDVAIVGYGHSVLECMAAAEMLEKVSYRRKFFIIVGGVT